MEPFNEYRIQINIDNVIDLPEIEELIFENQNVGSDIISKCFEYEGFEGGYKKVIKALFDYLDDNYVIKELNENKETLKSNLFENISEIESKISHLSYRFNECQESKENRRLECLKLKKRLEKLFEKINILLEFSYQQS